MIIIVCIKKIAVINTHAPPTCSTKEMASMGSHLGPRRSAPRHRIDPAKVAEDPCTVRKMKISQGTRLWIIVTRIRRPVKDILFPATACGKHAV